MLTAEAQERLIRVGPGTPMGELMRRYWIPVRPLSQLKEEEVMPIRILGEDLVLFITKKGELGLVGERCPHRAVLMKFGIPDEDGLRCCYHGWEFAPDGQCIDTPLESPTNKLKDQVKITAYPVREMGGLIWAYMGPQPVPLLAPWDLFVMPNAIRQIGISVLECNWLQCHENTGDPAHSVYLHGYMFKHMLEKNGDLEERTKDRQISTLHSRIDMGRGIESLYAHETQYGMEKGINYSKAMGADKDRQSRHSTVIFPFYTQTGGPGQVRQEFQIRVPIDDVSTITLPTAAIQPQQQSLPRCKTQFPTTTFRYLMKTANRCGISFSLKTPMPGSPRVRYTTGRRSNWAAPTCLSCSCAASLRSKCVLWRTEVTPKMSSESQAPCLT